MYSGALKRTMSRDVMDSKPLIEMNGILMFERGKYSGDFNRYEDFHIRM
jgi:hypothetical protein